MKTRYLFIVLVLALSACGTSNTPPPSTSVTEPAQEPTLPPYEDDTPSPPEINAPLVESPALVSVHFINSLDGWGITETQIVRTNDGGVTWYDVTPSGITETGYSAQFYAMNANSAWMLQPDNTNYPHSGFLYHTTDGGLTWANTTTPFSGAHLQFLDANNGWALADLGVGAGSNAVAVFQTNDGGATWNQTYINDPNAAGVGDSLPLGGLKAGIAPLNMQTAWVYGVTYSSGTIYLFRTDDGGANWSEVSLPLPAGAENFELGIDADQMKFVTPSDGYIVVRMTGDFYQAAVYASHDGGNTWELTLTPIPDGGSADFLSVQEMVIYNGAQFYITKDAARTWSVVPPDVKFGEIFAMMDFVDPNTGWVVTLDSLYRTNDGGTTWSPLVP